MKLFYFSLGLIVGLIIYQIYIKYVQVKKKTKGDIENRIFQLVESAIDIIYYFEVKPDFKHVYISPSIEYFLGEGIMDDLYNDPNGILKRTHPEDLEVMTRKVSGDIDYSKGIVQRIKDNQGTYRWFEEYITPIYEDGELTAVQGFMRNIDDKVKLQQDLEHRIVHDTLTDIHNRYFFDKIMDKYNKYMNTSVAIILCDLDELKYVNDNFGHKKGDVLIQQSAKLLKQYFTKNAIVSRIGGDEFAIVMISTDKAQVESLCENLDEYISQYNTHNQAFNIKISIGYAFNEHSLGEMESIFTEAEKNMYQHKRSKKENNLIISSR